MAYNHNYHRRFHPQIFNKTRRPNLAAMNKRRARLIAGQMSPQRINRKRAFKIMDPYCMGQTNLNASVDSFNYYNYKQPAQQEFPNYYYQSDHSYGSIKSIMFYNNVFFCG